MWVRTEEKYKQTNLLASNTSKYYMPEYESEQTSAENIPWVYGTTFDMHITSQITFLLEILRNPEERLCKVMKNIDQQNESFAAETSLSIRKTPFAGANRGILIHIESSQYVSIRNNASIYKEMTFNIHVFQEQTQRLDPQ